MADIHYETTDDVDVAELAAFYERCGHQTTSCMEKLARMIDRSFCFVTARSEDGRLVGIARGVSDGVRGHLAECKLDPALQGPGAVTRRDGRIEHDRAGIAREMATRVIRAIEEFGAEEVHVLAYGTEVDFCEELGFKKVGGMVALRLEVAAAVPVSAGT